MSRRIERSARKRFAFLLLHQIVIKVSQKSQWIWRFTVSFQNIYDVEYKTEIDYENRSTKTLEEGR